MFSDTENKLIKIMKHERKYRLSDLSDKFFGDDKPLYEAIRIGNLVRGIAKKCEFYNLTWTIEGEGGGRGGRTVWVTKRKRRKKHVEP